MTFNLQAATAAAALACKTEVAMCSSERGWFVQGAVLVCVCVCVPGERSAAPANKQLASQKAARRVVWGDTGAEGRGEMEMWGGEMRTQLTDGEIRGIDVGWRAGQANASANAGDGWGAAGLEIKGKAGRCHFLGNQRVGRGANQRAGAGGRQMPRPHGCALHDMSCWLHRFNGRTGCSAYHTLEGKGWVECGVGVD